MRKKDIVWWILAVVIIVAFYALITVGMLSNMDVDVMPTPSPTPIASPMPAPAPSPREVPKVVWIPEYSKADDVLVTAYCSCEICCGEWASKRPLDDNGNQIVYGATGKVLQAGRSVAVHPDFIPYGSYIYVQNPVTGRWDEFMAEDRSPSTNHVDVYYSNHQLALDSGYGNTATIYWSNEPLDMELVLSDGE